MPELRVYEHNINCFCGAPMKLRENREGKPFYGCSRHPDCDGAVGAHPNGKPMGRPADRETRKMRRMVHAAIQGIWDYEIREERNKAYAWLEHHAPKPHVSMMTKEECWHTLRLLGVL